MFLEHTPIEEYTIAGRKVFVKRDDLFGSWPAPPLAKLRGARDLLHKLHRQGVRLVGCWDTRISALGQGIAACAKELPEMKVIVTYPAKKNAEVPKTVQYAEDLGAEILPVPAGRINFSFARARTLVKSRGGVMLPFGLECQEAVDAVSLEAAFVPSEYIQDGTLVVCAGSGTTLAGLIIGLAWRAKRYIGVSSGRSPLSIRRCLSRYLGDLPNGLQIEPACWPYSMSLRQDCPFPSHPNYDLKAWRFLIDNIGRLDSPLLFWNVGA